MRNKIAAVYPPAYLHMVRVCKALSKKNRMRVLYVQWLSQLILSQPIPNGEPSPTLLAPEPSREN